MVIHNRMVGGILLVSGTAIGAGMLALPVSTGIAGFFPALILFVFCWFFMLYTAFLILEVTLWMPPNSNLITMAKTTLGKSGEVLSWITYLFLLYALTTAYVAGGGSIAVNFIQDISGIALPSWLGSIPLLIIFSYFVYRGTESVDYMNRVLMVGLIVSYGLIVIFVTPYVDSRFLVFSEPRSLLYSISLLITSYGFHIIIPTLTTYFHRDKKELTQALFIGSTIPLVIYVIWEILVLGTIPLEGAFGLKEGYVNGIDGGQLLSMALQSPILSLLIKIFSLCAIITSFLGVSLSLSDFLSDGLKIKKNRKGKTWIYLLTFFPPLIFTLLNPRAFFAALEYAGAFGVIVLLGLLPALMVWRGRYYLHIVSTFKAPGGKIALSLVILFSIFVMLLEISNKLGLTKALGV